MSKKDIDRIGERLRRSEQLLSIDDLRALDQFRRRHEQILDAFRAAMADLQLIEGANFSTRIKTSNTIIEKLKRPTPSGNPLRLSSMRDIAGARLVRAWRRDSSLPVASDDLAQQSNFAECLRAELEKREFRVKVIDKRSSGAATFGYRALHLEALRSGLRLEIQLRTTLQDVWAQIAEKLGDLWGRDHRYAEDPADPDREVRMSHGDWHEVDQEGRAEFVTDVVTKARREVVRSLRSLSTSIQTLEESTPKATDELTGELLSLYEQFDWLDSIKE